MSKIFSPSVKRPVHRRLAVAVVAMAALAGCGPDRAVGSIGYIKGFGGLVAADEPRAVVTARDVLSAGGTAVDAAVALYFTLAVTQPSTASLGGGGVCLVKTGTGKNLKVQVYDFLSPPSMASGSGRMPAAVPATVRGFYAMHATHGSFRWEELLAGPERLARFGTPVSRAFAADLAKAAPLIVRDPAARRIFFRPDGRPYGEGETLEQRDLAVTLGRIRRAPGDFYAGSLAREMAESAERVGIALTFEDLRDFRPQTRDSVTVKMEHDTAHFAPPPAIASSAASEIAKVLVDRPTERAAILTQASAQAAAAQAVMPATGFVILDHKGDSVACGLSTHGIFGTGRVLPGTGMVMAAAPGINGGPAAVAPAILVNHNVGEVRFAATATGGAEAPVALISTMVEAVKDGRKLDEAVQRPEPPRTPQTVLAPTRVNALFCSSGDPSMHKCRVASDPRGYGMAAVVGRD